MSRGFHISDVLTVTTGRLLSLRHMDGVYDVLSYMTGDSLFTHQLPRALNVCQPALLAQHPDLAAVEVPAGIGQETLREWLATIEAEYGAERIVTPLAEWHSQNPVEELCDLVGAERVWVVPSAAHEDAGE